VIFHLLQLLSRATHHAHEVADVAQHVGLLRLRGAGSKVDLTDSIEHLSKRRVLLDRRLIMASQVRKVLCRGLSFCKKQQKQGKVVQRELGCDHRSRSAFVRRRLRRTKSI